jgi:hypothetical protein
MLVTADGSQSTKFVTFNPSTMIITWDAPTEAGVYTCTITGFINNRYGTNTGNTDFILTVVDT